MESQASLVPYTRPTVDQIIDAWLHAKYGRTESVATHDRYRDEMTRFRALLHAQGIDLDGAPSFIATAAQGWAAMTQNSAQNGERDGEMVGRATFNMRLAILSSFYLFAIRKGYEGYERNPIDRVERRKVEAYATAQSLSRISITERLAAIDTSTLEGRRDQCVLWIALSTGKRLSEIAGVRRADLADDGERITVHFTRTKGGKEAFVQLTARRSAMLRDYLRALDKTMPEHDPQTVWVSLSPRNRGGPLSKRTLEYLCERHLGTQHFHALRHTFARAAEDAGAKVSEIQAMLGHSSIAVTGRYLAQLHSEVNPYAEAIEALFTGDANE